jgi:hypothetical protein
MELIKKNKLKGLALLSGSYLSLLKEDVGMFTTSTHEVFPES